MHWFHWLHIFNWVGKKYHEGRILVGNKIDCASIDQLCNKASESLSERSLCNRVVVMEFDCYSKAGVLGILIGNDMIR